MLQGNVLMNCVMGVVIRVMDTLFLSPFILMVFINFRGSIEVSILFYWIMCLYLVVWDQGSSQWHKKDCILLIVFVIQWSLPVE